MQIEYWNEIVVVMVVGGRGSVHVCIMLMSYIFMQREEVGTVLFAHSLNGTCSWQLQGGSGSPIPPSGSAHVNETRDLISYGHFQTINCGLHLYLHGTKLNFVCSFFFFFFFF